MHLEKCTMITRGYCRDGKCANPGMLVIGEILVPSLSASTAYPTDNRSEATQQSKANKNKTTKSGKWASFRFFIDADAVVWIIFSTFAPEKNSSEE